jgi:pimeloyl-ACP methyl ester carboxylesterase
MEFGSGKRSRPSSPHQGGRAGLSSYPAPRKTRASSFGLHDDAAVVRRQIEQIDGPVVVVGHSYGGAVISEGAADLPNVRHLIYLAAFQLDVGESALGLLGGIPLPRWIVDDGTITVETAHEVFFHDLQQDDAERAVARLLPFSWAGVEETLRAAAWRAVRSTYVICDQDSAIPPSVQEQMSARATDVRRLPGGHSPFLSRPSDVAELIADVATAVA